MKYLIIGSGVAGFTAARELAKAEPAPEIHLYNAESVPYYPRPRLWEFIAGKIEAEKLIFQPKEWYAGQGIHLHSNLRASHIEPAEHRVRFSDGSRDNYDQLLLACGANPFTPPLPGIDLPGVFTLRTLQDARNISAHASDIDDIIVIGGGLLGLETANSLRIKGKNVIVLEFMSHLLPRQLDQQGSQVLQSYLESLGLQIINGAQTEAIRQENDRLVIHLKDGRQLHTGQVIFSAGIRPRLELALDAGIESTKGVLVDDYLQTSADGIFAAGDVCEHNGIVYGIIPAAMEQARAAAKNMLSQQSARYQGTLPATRLKIAGAEFNTLGDANPEDDSGVKVIRLQQPDNGIYRRLNLRDGKISGAILLGEAQNIRPIKTLIDRKINVSEHIEKISTPSFDFKSLLV